MAEITEIKLSKLRQRNADECRQLCKAGSVVIVARGRGRIFSLRLYKPPGDIGQREHFWPWYRFRNATIKQFEEVLLVGDILLSVDGVPTFVVERYE